MTKKTFKPKNHEDFEILDADGQVFGHVRVKPSGVLWAPKGSHSWYKLTLEQFADCAVSQGKKQKK